jgi:hypothetical protein
LNAARSARARTHAHGRTLLTNNTPSAPPLPLPKPAAATLPGFSGSAAYTGTLLPGFPDTTFIPTAIGPFGTQSDWMNNFVFQDANNIWSACAFQNNIPVLPNSKGFNIVAGVHHYSRPNAAAPFALVGTFVNQTAIDLVSFMCGPHFMLLVTIYDYNGVNGASVISFNTTDNSWSYFLQDDLSTGSGRGIQFRGVAFVPGTDTTSGCANLAGLQCSKYCAPKPFKSTSMLALRLDATALPYNAKGCSASTMVVPAYFDEIDIATGKLVQSIPVPQLMSPVTQAPSAANMYPVYPPLGKQTLPPPFVTDPYDIRQAQSVGITIDNTEGGGGTSWDGCFFSFIGYEAYTYTSGYIDHVALGGAIVPTTPAACKSMDAGESRERARAKSAQAFPCAPRMRAARARYRAPCTRTFRLTPIRARPPGRRLQLLAHVRHDRRQWQDGPDPALRGHDGRQHADGLLPPAALRPLGRHPLLRHRRRRHRVLPHRRGQRRQRARHRELQQRRQRGQLQLALHRPRRHQPHAPVRHVAQRRRHGHPQGLHLGHDAHGDQPERLAH